MKILRFILVAGLLFMVSCSSMKTKNEERNPRENLEFFYNVQEEQEEDERAKVYYHGEHYFKD